MSSVVVLCDAAWPSWLGQEPWLSAWAPQRFADHARWVASRLEGLARLRRHVPRAERWRRARGGSTGCGRRSAQSVRLPTRRARSTGCSSRTSAPIEAIAEVAPSLGRALLLERCPPTTTPRCGATSRVGAGTAGARGEASRLASGPAASWRRRRTARRASRRTSRGRRRAAALVLAMGRRRRRSSGGSAGDDVELLAAALQHADGDVDTVELRAGRSGWDRQLATALPVLAAVPGSLRTIHLHGIVSSTGPLREPVGLLDVEQHNASWSLAESDPTLVRRLAGSWR